MQVRLISRTENAEWLCTCAAATCTNMNPTTKILEHAIASGHTGVLEHAVFTFEVDGLSRAALAQLTRHRLASFDVQSQRYVKLAFPYYVFPKSFEEYGFEEQAEDVMDMAMKLYQDMLDAGVPMEDARYVTPQAVPTELVMTMNCRELLHFFSLRTCNRAQWEIREMADMMLRICKQECPVIFKNAGPGCVRGACPERKPCGHPRKGEATQ